MYSHNLFNIHIPCFHWFIKKMTWRDFCPTEQTSRVLTKQCDSVRDSRNNENRLSSYAQIHWYIWCIFKLSNITHSITVLMETAKTNPQHSLDEKVRHGTYSGCARGWLIGSRSHVARAKCCLMVRGVLETIIIPLNKCFILMTWQRLPELVPWF